MKNNVKRNVAVGTVVALALGGGGLAVAATTQQHGTAARTDRQKAFLDDAAKRLNVTPEQLTDALKGAFGDQLDQAVKAGRLTQKQADAIKARAAHAPGLPLGGGFGGPGRGGPGGPGGPPMRGPQDSPFAAGLDAAATYLGLTQAELQAKLQDGKTSLADVAKAAGTSTDGLEAAIVAAEKTKLAAAVKAGKLTQKQADALEAKLTQIVADRVSGKRPGPVGLGGPRGLRHGPPHGPGGQGGLGGPFPGHP